MVENLKALSAIPVFGFEWSGCHAEIEDEEYSDRNWTRLLACVPVLNFLAGGSMIKVAVETLSITAEEAKNHRGIEHQKTKSAALLVRGVATLFFAGILFVVADGVTTAGRALFRAEKEGSNQGE